MQTVPDFKLSKKIRKVRLTDLHSLLQPPGRATAMNRRAGAVCVVHRS